MSRNSHLATNGHAEIFRQCLSEWTVFKQLPVYVSDIPSGYDYNTWSTSTQRWYLKENLCEHKWLRFSKINSLVSITHLAKVLPPPTSSFYPELGHFPRFISKRRVYWNCQSWNELWVVFCNLGLILELMIVMVYLYILMDSPSWLRWSYWNC